MSSTSGSSRIALERSPESRRRIETEGPHAGVLVVILGRILEGDELVGIDSYVRVHPGSFVFRVSPGRFQLGAYEDRNRNGLLDPDERAVRVTDAPILVVGPGDTARFDIRLAEGATLDELTEPLDVLGIVERTPEEQREFSLWALSTQGAICNDLDDPRFGPSAGLRGLWEPVDFLNEGLAGIYFLEAYDPDRIPVLFVHGMGGHPQELRTLIEGLDRGRFQPWFYFYPSGIGMDSIARHLAGLLKRLHVRHDFEELGIVAFSMGGLVSRGAIFEYERDTHRDDIRLFISIATPWGGQPRAERASDARIALPVSFADMAPSSAYLRRLFYQNDGGESPKKLPRLVETHMFIGFRMSRSGSVANDGQVTVASQARTEAQEEAKTIRAWDYGHVEIAHSPNAVERMNRLLRERFD